MSLMIENDGQIFLEVFEPGTEIAGIFSNSLQGVGADVVGRFVKREEDGSKTIDTYYFTTWEGLTEKLTALGFRSFIEHDPAREVSAADIAIPVMREKHKEFISVEGLPVHGGVVKARTYFR